MSELAVKRLLLQTPAFAHGAPGVTPWPPEPLDYIFQEGVASPYNAMYDYIGNLGSPVIIDATEDIGVLNLSRACTHTSDGTLYVTYCKNLAGVSQIYIKKSVDDGVTWTDETLLSTYAGMNGQTQHWPCIAVDSDDHLHVVWRGQATGYTTGTQIWYRKYTDAWGAITRISTYANMSISPEDVPCIAVDSNDYLHVIWVGKATGYTRNQTWYNKYTDAWAGPVRISTYAGMSGQAQLYPCIAVDSDDHLHVVWHGQATGYTTGTQIWYAKGVSPYEAADWVTPIRISDYTDMEDYAQYNPSVAVDSSDYIHVIWRGRTTGYLDFYKIWYAVYTDSWATPECLQPVGQSTLGNLRWSRWPR